MHQQLFDFSILMQIQNNSIHIRSSVFEKLKYFICFLFPSSALDLPHQRADLDVDVNFPGERRPIPEWLSCHEGSKITLRSRESIYDSASYFFKCKSKTCKVTRQASPVPWVSYGYLRVKT